MKHVLHYVLIATCLTSVSVACASTLAPVQHPPTMEDCDPSDWSPRRPDVDYSLCEEGRAAQQASPAQ